MAATLTTLPDFVVAIADDGRVAITLVNQNGTELRTLDFHPDGPVANAVVAWMGMGAPSAMNALADAMNLYLHAEFAAI